VVVRGNMRYRRGSDVVYRNGAFLLAGVLAGVWWIAFSLFEGEVKWALVGLLVVPFGIYLNLTLRVVLGDARLSIHAYRSTEQIPYESIRTARFTGRRAGARFLEIYLTDGSKVGVHGSRASFLPFHHPGWQRPLAAEIIERAERARSNVGDLELPTKPGDVVTSGKRWMPPSPDSRSDRDREDRIRVVSLVAVGVAIWIVVVLFSTEEPLAFLGGCIWFAATVLTVTVAVRYTWRRVLSRIPARFAESPSTPIRILTAVVKAFAVYAVGLLTLVVAVDVPDFIIHHL
jgi:Ca2+/Na+ antiporter